MPTPRSDLPAGTEVQRRRNQQTGTHVIVKRADSLDDPAGTWETVCQEHGQVCAHETLTLARLFASSPLDWCERCMNAADEASMTDRCASCDFMLEERHTTCQGHQYCLPECPRCGGELVPIERVAS